MHPTSKLSPWTFDQLEAYHAVLRGRPSPRRSDMDQFIFPHEIDYYERPLVPVGGEWCGWLEALAAVVCGFAMGLVLWRFAG